MKHILLSLLVLAVLSSPVTAQESQVPHSTGEIKLSFAPLVKKATPAVVNIYATRVVRERFSPFFSDRFFDEFFGGTPFGSLSNRVQNSLGSGVIVRDDGIILTNAHVAGDAYEVMVVLQNRREFSAEVLYVDKRSDLAVLKIDAGEALPYLPLGNSNNLEVGDLTLAVGNPFGVGQTVTSGIVSAVARTLKDGRDMGYYIQTDAAINPGNSGGALLNMKGELIGINAAIYSRDGGFLGIGFAIPSNLAKTALTAVENDGVVLRPWLGATTQSVTPDMAESLDLSVPSGAIVRSVYDGSPAEKAGLRTGDVILSINEQDVFDEHGVRYHVATLPLDSVATITYSRSGARKTAQFDVKLPPEEPPRNATKLAGNNPFNGATVVNISPAVIEDLGSDIPAKGVVVSDVERGSTASRLGVREGDAIITINGAYINNVEDVKKALTEGDGRRGWRIQFKRGEQTVTTVVG